MVTPNAEYVIRILYPVVIFMNSPGPYKVIQEKYINSSILLSQIDPFGTYFP